jgi:hypothetical protein
MKVLLSSSHSPFNFTGTNNTVVNAMSRWFGGRHSMMAHSRTRLSPSKNLWEDFAIIKEEQKGYMKNIFYKLFFNKTAPEINRISASQSIEDI